MEQKERLAMVSIPVQQGSKLYDFSEALREGTIFPELNLPFYLADSVPKTIDESRIIVIRAAFRKIGNS